jgi:Flavin reductase like domain
MQFDFDRMTPERRFEFMTSTIVPRPIAIVTTCGADGSINGAPYSFFGLLSHDPAVIAIGVLPHPEGRMKDTGVSGSGRSRGLPLRSRPSGAIPRPRCRTGGIAG